MTTLALLIDFKPVVRASYIVLTPVLIILVILIFTALTKKK